MSFRLAKALRSGRSAPTRPLSREMILARLLNKRAAAAQAGLTRLEMQLRNQISWALPIQRPASDERACEPAEPPACGEPPDSA